MYDSHNCRILVNKKKVEDYKLPCGVLPTDLRTGLRDNKTNIISILDKLDIKILVEDDKTADKNNNPKMS